MFFFQGVCTEAGMYALRERRVHVTQEDFELAEGIQANIESGATESINFGRFEGALAAFNQTVDDLLADA